MASKCAHMLPWGFMAVLMAVLSLYSLMSEAAHEWIGIAWGASALIHARQTAAILLSALSRQASVRRRAEHLLAMALLAAALITVLTGLLMSREALPILRLKGYQAALIPVHFAAAHWLLLLMGIHIGLHWRGLIEALFPRNSALLKRAALASFAFAAAAGVPAAANRDLTESLIAAAEYLNLDPARPIALHGFETFCILCAFAALGMLLQAALKMFSRGRRFGRRTSALMRTQAC